MKKQQERTIEVQEVLSGLTRNSKLSRKRRSTQLNVNESILGDSIEIMIERLKEGEGEEGIQDRDLVYNDNESKTINPVTNIRSDKMELMLEEKIGEYEHRNRTLKIVKDDEINDEPPKETGEKTAE